MDANISGHEDGSHGRGLAIGHSVGGVESAEVPGGVWAWSLDKKVRHGFELFGVVIETRNKEGGDFGEDVFLFQVDDAVFHRFKGRPAVASVKIVGKGFSVHVGAREIRGKKVDGLKGKVAIGNQNGKKPFVLGDLGCLQNKFKVDSGFCVGEGDASGSLGQGF